jgi:predicted amidohydrolase
VTLEVSLIQLRTPASQVDSLRQATPLVREAAARGARLIATPEGSNILQRNRSRLLEALVPMENDVAVIGYRALAAELGVWILIGSAMVLRADGKVANRSILVNSEGGVVATYDKLHMFDVDLPPGS